MERAVMSASSQAIRIEEKRARPRRRRKWIIWIAVVLAIAAFIPIRLDRLKKRLEASITASLGRRVSAQNIDFHLLPRPGFNLENFTIEDDPAFSSEPLLRSDSVTANLRLRSLLGARIEIARLSLKEPSLNLVRNSQGRWNVESLLTEADFSLWLASEDLWNMRLAARPIRSDANLGDTGTLKVSGSFQRAPDLRATPFQ